MSKKFNFLFNTAAVLLVFCSFISVQGLYEFTLSDAMTYSQTTEHWSVDAIVPQISGMADPKAQAELNVIFLTDASEMLKEYQQMAAEAVKSLMDQNDLNFMYEYRYDIVTDSPRFFVFKTSQTYRSSLVETFEKYWTLDKQSGKLLEFTDVVKSHSKLNDIRDEILTQMKKFNNVMGASLYTPEDGSLDMAMEHIGEKQHWFFDEDQLFTVTFDKFEVGPGVLGNPQFKISQRTVFYK